MGICYSPGCAFAKHITKFNGGNGDDIAAEYDNYSEYNSTVVGITAENKMRAMKAAMMAVKNPYTVTDMADYEA